MQKNGSRVLESLMHKNSSVLETMLDRAAEALGGFREERSGNDGSDYDRAGGFAGAVDSEQ